MKLLDLNNPFTIKLRDQEGNEKDLKGTFRTYTKEEQLEAKKKYSDVVKNTEEIQKVARNLQRVAKQVEIKENLKDYEAVDKLYGEQMKLEDKLESLGKKVKDVGDEGLKERFAKCLGGEHKDEILALAEAVGYEVVYAKITEGVQEGKSID